MFENFPIPTIFAHRGASAYAPENTLASFQLAVKQKAPAIELDTKLSADGQVVVIHDSTVDRTTNGKGFVANKTLAQLRELDAGSFFSPKFRCERIPTLDEVFETVGKQILINVEITNYTTPNDALPETVAGIVKKHRMEKRVIFSSFHTPNLERVYRLLPEVPVCLLAVEGILGIWARLVQSRSDIYGAIHPYVNDVTCKLIENAHKRGQRVHVWTVNRANDMKKLFDWKVDGIFTDDPLLARQVLEETGV